MVMIGEVCDMTGRKEDDGGGSGYEWRGVVVAIARIRRIDKD